MAYSEKELRELFVEGLAHEIALAEVGERAHKEATKIANNLNKEAVVKLLHKKIHTHMNHGVKPIPFLQMDEVKALRK